MAVLGCFPLIGLPLGRMIISMVVKSNFLLVDSHRFFLLLVGFSVLIVAGISRAQDAKQVDLFPRTGGMWLPSQLPELEGPLRTLGLEIDPLQLADPTSNSGVHH